MPDGQLPEPPIRNPQSAIRNLYACLYRPPRASQAGELVAIARAFSPRYQVHSADLVVIDVSGLERLLGPARTIGDELRKAATARGIHAHVAVASTQTAAIVLAHTRPGLTVIARGAETEAVASTAVGILEKLGTQSTQAPQRKPDQKISADSALSAFQRWGVKTLGQLASLPDAELVSRFGREAARWQMVARGLDAWPLVPTLDEERFDASLDLEWPIDGLEPLSFVLTRLLEPICTRLERRDRGAAVVHVLLELVGGGSHVRRLELPTPLRDVRALRTLALLDLESHPPDAAIDRVTVVIDPTPGRVLQHTLFTRAHPTPEQLSTLLARLGAVMGQDRVGAPAVVDTYRPGAFAMQPFATLHENRTQSAQSQSFSASSAPSAFPVSAARRCRQPVPARVAVDDDGRPVRVTTDRRGYAGGSVVRCAGPWKTSGNWWTGEAGDPGGAGGAGGAGRAGATFPPNQPFPPIQPFPSAQPWDRDEWDVALGDGAVYRIFRDRAADGWFIDAIVD